MNDKKYINPPNFEKNSSNFMLFLVYFISWLKQLNSISINELLL